MFLSSIARRQQTSLQFQTRQFARHFNIAKRQAIDMKDNLHTYEYIPEMISNLTPAPEYPEKAMKGRAKTQKQYRDSQANLEQLRTSSLTKRAQEQRHAAGRLGSHIKFEEMKQEVQKIKDKENSDRLKKLSSKRKGGYEWPTLEIDDQFSLPYGVGFDDIIKQKAALIDSQKKVNNKVMDKLVETLGYMDYRDALACNKYILEAKRSGDYHQMARARVLQVAISRLSNRKKKQVQDKIKTEIQNSAAETPMSRGSDEYRNKFDDLQLQEIMKTDPEMAEYYQDQLYNIKADKETDYNKILDIHDRFDYFRDPDKMARKIKNEEFDLKNEEPVTDQDLLSTELSDPEHQDLYYRYKQMREINVETRKEKYLELRQIADNIRSQQKKLDGSFDSEDGFASVRRLQHTVLEKDNINTEFETKIAQIRMSHEVKKMQVSDIMEDDNDAIIDKYGAFTPFTRYTDEQKTTSHLPSEIRKLMHLQDQQQELQNQKILIGDQQTSEQYTQWNTMNEKYLKAKWDWYVDSKLSQFRFTFKDLEEDSRYGKAHDEKMEARVEFMYDYMDYKNDRHRVRERFVSEMHKKSNLVDVGDLLDEYMLDSKANMADYYDPARHMFEEPTMAARDVTETDLDWQKAFLKEFEDITPTFLDDQDCFDDLHPSEGNKLKEVMKEIKYRDGQRDYSLDNLTAEEKQEIALFHSMKQDPFYKHHLRTHLSQFADNLSEDALTAIHGPHEVDPDDWIKFDRINLFDFRRNLPQQEREAKLDKVGRAWGCGKRKASIAVVYVQAGSGKVTINNKPMLEYFHIPSQRYRILLPLTVTQYTCLLDVNINVKGGGLTGQAEACVPAIARALQSFDVDTRPVLKYLRLLKNDPRRVERKKPGLIKARKGQVYRRR